MNESSVVFSLAPEVSRDRCLGGLPIAYPRCALVLVKFHSSFGEGLAQVFETPICDFGCHDERDVVHASPDVDAPSSVDHHLGVPRKVSAEMFLGILQ
jgi:hypothetical protein